MNSRLPQGYGGGPSNMQGMIRQAQKMQEEMEALRADLDLREYEVKAGGGMVSVKINGKKQILSMGQLPSKGNLASLVSCLEFDFIPRL